MKNTKELKTKGKITIKAPKVKDRKKFAPATKVDKSKKDYDRKKETFDESTNIAELVDAVITKNYAKANLHLKQAVESKISEKIQQELNTPLF